MNQEAPIKLEDKCLRALIAVSSRYIAKKYLLAWRSEFANLNQI